MIDLISGLLGTDAETSSQILQTVVTALKSAGWAIATYHLVTALPLIVATIKGLFTGVSALNPTALAISLIVAAGVAIWENWDGIKEFFENIWNTVKEKVEAAWSAVSEWWTTNIDEPLSQAWGTVQGFLEGIWTAVKDAISGAWDKVKEWMGPELAGQLEEKWKGVKEFFTGIWNGIKSAVDGAIISVQEFLGLGDKSKATGVHNSDTGVSHGGTGRSFGAGAGSNANGLNFVPYNDYLTRLHFGETVLSRNEAERYRRGEGQNQQIDYQGLFSGIRAAVRQGMEEANIMLDGERITENVNRRQADDIRSRRFAMA